MVNEPYQIKDYDHGEVDAFYTCLKEGKLSSRGQVLVSTDRYELESFNPEGTIPVATFFYEKYSTKKIYFYVTSFTEFTEIDWSVSHGEVYSLFAIQWCDDVNSWEKTPWHCCSVISKQPQPLLHKEAANWMLKRMTTKGCLIAGVDDFKKGTLELLI